MKTKLFIALFTSLTLIGLQAEDGKGKGKGKGGKGGDRAAMILKASDTDKDGSLSKDEFLASRMGKGLTEKKGADAAEKAFAKLDADSSGSISKEELGKLGGGKGKGKGGKGKKGAE